MKRDDAFLLWLLKLQVVAARVFRLHFSKLRVQTSLLASSNSKVKSKRLVGSLLVCNLLDLCCPAPPHRHRLMKLNTGFNLIRGVKLATQSRTKRRSVKREANRPEHHAKISDPDHMIYGHKLWSMRSVVILAQVLRKGVPRTSWA